MDGLNGVIGIIESFKSSIFTVQYSGLNDFQLVAPAIEENLALLQYGTLLVRAEDIINNVFKNVMIIENIQIDTSSDNGWLITASGRGLKSILERRIIWGQYNVSGRAEQSIRTAISNAIISPSDPNRKINNFILGTDKNLQKTLDTQLFGDNLATWISETCELLGYGFDITIQNGKYQFDMYEGTDRSNSVIFSPTFDNLLSSTFTERMEDFQNAALIGGEGEGTSKRTASVGSASGLDRYEGYIDGSSVSSNGQIITEATYIDMLKGYGQTELAQKIRFTTSFTGEIDPTGVYRLNEDYFLGDLVKIQNEIGIEATARINEIIYAEDENGYTVNPTFSEWEVI